MTLKNHETNSWFVPSLKVKYDHPVVAKGSLQKKKR